MGKKQFKSESKRLLDLMINSIYTHKEIFLRELISNASDAIDKLAFISLTDNKVGLNRSDFKIELTINDKERTLTIKDNGVGMSQKDLEENLGTIASSGSYKFKKEMEKNDDIDIIGQFGVGFYSAFMVADKITVLTKKYGEETGYKWESSGVDGYTIEEANLSEPGTEITLKIKEDVEEGNYSEFLQEHRISGLVKKYSNYIRYPILMEVSKQQVKEGTGVDGKDPEYETVTEIETLNSMVPIWQKNKKDVTDEDYNNFYKEKFFDMEDPLHTIVTAVEGVVTYKALLYIPSKTPFNYYTKEYKPGLQLYSSGVMIMENCEDLLPEYFGFVKGVVETQDLSLNISREMLQHNRQLKTIALHIGRKIKSELQTLLKKEREKYEKFFENFGRQLKYGVVSDYGVNKDEVKDLILFYSSTEKKLVTLAEYVERMKKDQKYIYYAIGDNVNVIDSLPQIEGLQDKGYEILYLTEDIDEFTIQGLQSFEEKEFRSVADDDLELSKKDEEEIKEKEKDFEGTLNFVKEVLKDDVKDVIISKKLKSHPVCLTAQGGMSFEMEKYMNQVNPEGQMKAERVLELNGSHDSIIALKNTIDTNPEKAKKYAKILYNQAVLIAGLDIENPSEYTDLVTSLID